MIPRFCKDRFLWRVSLLALLMMACAASTATFRLAVGDELSFDIAPGTVRRFMLTAEAGDFVRLIVEQDEVDVISRLLAPSGEEVIAVDRIFGDSGPEPLRALIERSGDHTLEIRAFERLGPSGRVTVRLDAVRHATPKDRLAALRLGALRQAEVLAYSSRLEEAIPSYHRVIEQSVKHRDADLWSEAMVRLASAHIRLSQTEPARQALVGVVEAEELGQPIWQILALDILSYLDLVDRQPRAAIQHIEAALARPEIAGLSLRQARLLANLGRARQMQGAIQDALDAYRRAADLFRSWKTSYRANLQHNLGALHRHYLGQPGKALGFFERAAENLRELGYQPRLASALNQIGASYEDLGEPEAAAKAYREALEIRRDQQDSCAVANTLARLALLEVDFEDSCAWIQGLLGLFGGRETRQAEWAAEARAIVESGDCSRNQQAIRSRLAVFAERQGDLITARDDFRQNRQDAQARDHRDAEVEALVGLARVCRNGLACQDEPIALTTRALEIVEDTRSGLAREDLRLAFGNRTQALFELHIDLQWEHGDHVAALVTAEKARARALLDRLRQIDADVRSGAEGEALERTSASICRRRSSNARARAFSAVTSAAT